jgi:hypothetical protein
MDSKVKKSLDDFLLQGADGSTEVSATPDIAAAEPNDGRTGNLAPGGVTAHQRGQMLAARFKDEGVIPVLIFGARASGKTSFLASLFQFVHIAPKSKATLSLTLDALPDDNVDWGNMRRYATILFERKVYDFMDKKAPQSTLDPLPFFVPVELKPTSKQSQKFAFLEGRGEWYQPLTEGDSPHQPFQGEIEGLLKAYNAPLCVIYVAPFATGGSETSVKESPNSQSLKDRDLGLTGSISQYQELRRATGHLDHHLFLFTKWDVRCKGIKDLDLIWPDHEVVHSEIAARYPISFARYLNMQFGVPKSNKATTHYCSGIFDDKAVMAPAEEDRAALDIFPMKLWDWLYFATNQQPLYPEIRPKPLGILDKLLKLLRG